MLPLNRVTSCLAIFATLLLSAAASGEERIQPVEPGRLKAIIASAPEPPAEALDLGLKLRLIDYIDCTDADDPHDFMDQGTSQIVEGQIVEGKGGNYRLSAQHKHAFFSYGYKTAGRDKPVLIVVEYPDDARRRFALMTHDSMRPAGPHQSFSMEGGVYTGGALPNTGKMQYFTLLNWPQDNWSPLIAMSYQRQGGGAAVSRVWVYAVDAFEPLAIDVPDEENDRILDMFFPLEFLATRDNFGWNSPKAVDHMIDYCKMIGLNRVTMMLYGNQANWGCKASIPAWDVPEDRGLEKILERMDKKGGVGLIFGIVADGMYGDIKHDGQLVRDLPPEERKRVLLEGFDQIIDRYGKYKSFQGFSLGSLESIGFYDTLHEAGLVEEVVQHIKKRRPDFAVQTYLGCSRLQTSFFMTTKDRGRTYAAPTSSEVVLNWEASGKPWEAYLSETILQSWKSWGHDPTAMRAVKGLDLYEKKNPDDYRTAATYRNDPREALYYDVAHSPSKSDLVATDYGAIFSFFDEGWVGLNAGHNFWYSKFWTAPDFNAAGPLAIAPWTTLMSHRDRQAITAGTWTVKYFGMEVAMRRFAKSFRSLPPTMLTDLPAGEIDTFKARWTRYEGKRYVQLISNIPFDSEIVCDGERVRLAPFGMKTLVEDREEPPTLEGHVPKAYYDWVVERIRRYDDLLKEVRALDPAAGPEVYAAVSKEAKKLFRAKKVRAADLHLAYGLEEELRLRRNLLAPPALSVPFVDQAPSLIGNLDAWPKESSDKTAGMTTDNGEFLQAHTYFPNGWKGDADLSARLRFAHDGETLFIGIAVKDSDPTDKDTCELWLSHSGYRDWKSELVKPDIRWNLKIPAGEGTASKGLQWKTTHVEGGYVLEGSVPLADIQLQPGGRIGFFLTCRDMDNEPGPDERKSWASKQVLHYPYQPNFPAWSDARNCGELVLEAE